MLELLQGVHYSWLLTSFKIMSLLSFIFDSLKIHPPLDLFPLKQNDVCVFLRIVNRLIIWVVELKQFVSAIIVLFLV